MVKKIASIFLVVLVMTAAVLPAALAEEEDYTLDPNGGYYYVVTGNGKGLNVRDAPGGNIVGSLKYGTQIYVEAFSTPEWALITYRYNKPGYGVGDYAAWVSTRYLSRYNPGRYVPPSGGGTQPSGSTTDNLASINAIFRTAVKVSAPYTVVARPVRASGWVNLRWAPNTEAERIATCPQGKVLVVMAELKSWYQVQDPDTGMVGFIMKKYTSIQ